MAELSGPQRKQLVVALLDAFPSRGDLTRMVSFGLGENLDRIVGVGGLQEAAFQLVVWAEAQGRLADLVEAAAAENTGNQTLRAFVDGVWAPLANNAFLTGADRDGRDARPLGVPVSSLDLSPHPSKRPTDGGGPSPASESFFVSYTQADRGWAEWIAWQLEQAGHQVTLQAWDFRPGGNFVLEMDRATTGSGRTIAVLSPDYLTSSFAAAEWAAAFAQDPTGEARRLIPIRVREFERRGLLAQIVYVDLVGLDADAARAKLLAAVAPDRTKPAVAPPFPTGEQTGRPRPAFPVVPNASIRRAIVLTALEVEYEAVRALLTDPREEVHPRGTVYERGHFTGRTNSWDVGLVRVGKGNERAALEAERAIEYFAPAVALFVGVAGGLKDVVLGDVVAATKVYGYESGKDESDFRPRPEVGQSSYPLVQRAYAVARAGRWRERVGDTTRRTAGLKVLVEPIAAGGKIVASTGSTTARLLRQTYGDAVAVEMEGAGFLTATHASSNVHSLVVRGISDLVDDKPAADAAGWQARAARHATAFAFEVLDGLDTEPSA